MQNKQLNEISLILTIFPFFFFLINTPDYYFYYFNMYSVRIDLNIWIVRGHQGSDFLSILIGFLGSTFWCKMEGRGRRENTKVYDKIWLGFVHARQKTCVSFNIEKYIDIYIEEFNSNSVSAVCHFPRSIRRLNHHRTTPHFWQLPPLIIFLFSYSFSNRLGIYFLATNQLESLYLD